MAQHQLGSNNASCDGNDNETDRGGSTGNDDDRNADDPVTDTGTRTITSSIKTSLRDALAGAAAGAVAKTAVAPIERVKLLMQLRGSISGAGVGNMGGGQPLPLIGGSSGSGVVASNWSAWSVASAVYRKEGVLAFWRGNTPNVLRQGGAAALNFMLMDRYKIAITPLLNLTLHLPSSRPHLARQKRRKLVSSFLSGGLAGGTTTTVLYPIEFMRTRLAMDTGGCIETRLYPRGMRDVFCGIWKTDGMRGLYQGYGIALGGVVLYRALHLGGYDACKTELVYRRRQEGGASAVEAPLTFLERFGIAQFVSVTAGTVCYPIDSVRRRLMMQAGLPLDERLYTNSVHAFRRIFLEEGVRGFYFGIGPNLVRSFGGAMLLVSYDAFKGRSC